jgi:hypothetical protein
MAEERRKEPEGWLKRQRSSLCKSARYEFETAPARRRLPARLFLCEDEWNEKEINFREDGKRPKLSD